MRKILLAVAIAASLIGGSPAFAQSQQGGYLGQNPGGQQASVPPPSVHGSGQGGYLGLNHGANLAPARVVEGDMSSPMGWCQKSPEPSRCRGRAVDDHKICAGKEGDSYLSCRFALDRMYFK
jgi:hypothetical protein